MGDGEDRPELRLVATQKGKVLFEVTPAAAPGAPGIQLNAPSRELPGREGSEPVGRFTDLVISELGDAIDAVASEIIGRLQNAHPSEITIELKLGLTGEAKVPFVASSRGDGAVTVKLMWKRPSETQSS